MVRERLLRHALQRCASYRLCDLRWMSRCSNGVLAAEVAPTVFSECQVRIAQQHLRVADLLGEQATSAKLALSAFDALDGADKLLSALRGAPRGTEVPAELDAAVRLLRSTDAQLATFFEAFAEDLRRGPAAQPSTPAREALLDDAVSSHIACSVLLQHFVATSQERGVGGGRRRPAEAPGAGVLEPMAGIEGLVRSAAAEASRICDHAFGFSPAVEVAAAPPPPAETAAPVYVGSLVFHALLEVLKNALAAAARAHGERGAVSVRVQRGRGGVVSAAIVDNGFGVTPARRRDILRLGRPRGGDDVYDRLDEQQSYASPQAPPLSGLGIGLPLARLMVSHFGGELQLASAPGLGTTCVVTLPLSDAVRERMPATYGAHAPAHAGA